MKKLLIFLPLFIACKKSTVPTATSDTSNNVSIGKQIKTENLLNDCNFDNTISSPTNVLTQAQQASYLNIWQKMFLKKNNLSAAYFNDHLVNATVSSSSWDAGVSFRIDYLWNFGWIQFHNFDTFIVNMKSTFGAGRNINIARNVFLSEREILNSIYDLPETQITKVNDIASLKLKNCSEVNSWVQSNSSYSKVNFVKSSFYVHQKDIGKMGDPYIILGGTINQQNNSCISGSLNLKNGLIEIYETTCNQTSN